jgi:hypothetical protein
VLIAADNEGTLGGVAARPADSDSTREPDRLFHRGTFHRRLKLFRMTIQQTHLNPTGGGSRRCSMPGPL